MFLATEKYLKDPNNRSEAPVIFFHNAMKKLDITANDAQPKFYGVIEEMVADKEINWLRVAMVSSIISDHTALLIPPLGLVSQSANSMYSLHQYRTDISPLTPPLRLV